MTTTFVGYVLLGVAGLLILIGNVLDPAHDRAGRLECSNVSDRVGRRESSARVIVMAYFIAIDQYRITPAATNGGAGLPNHAATDVGEAARGVGPAAHLAAAER